MNLQKSLDDINERIEKLEKKMEISDLQKKLDLINERVENLEKRTHEKSDIENKQIIKN
ncbi:12843_t:CDS:1, partial [Dentiscutata heterogama]